MSEQEDSIFTKIIKGDIPSHKVYEDDYTYAFMDIYPIQPGQVLVVPKAETPTAWDLDDDQYHALMDTVKKIANKMREVFPDKKRIGIMIEGLDVDNHAHVKIFPINSGDEFRNIPDMNAEPDHQALAELAQKLAIEDN